MDKRGGGAREYHDFLSKIFVSVPKNFVEEPFCVSENFWYRKRLGIREGGGYHDLPSKLFCLTVPNHLVEELFCVSESFGYRKILCLRGEYHNFRKKICCLTLPKNFVAESFCVSQNFWYRKNLWIRGGEGGSITIVCQKFFVSQCRKIS